jgi:hypothetical protein
MSKEGVLPALPPFAADDFSGFLLTKEQLKCIIYNGYILF